MNENFICFGEDWGEHPTSSQHIFIALMKKGAKVLWVNSIGYRSPQLNISDLRRIVKKLSHWRAQPQDSSLPNLRIISPLVFPWFHIPFFRNINKRLLLRALKKQGGAKPGAIIWLAFPTPVDVLGALQEKLSIYYCADEYSEIPGVRKELMIRMEQELLGKADLVLVSSQKLFESKKGGNPRTYLIPHGVDYAHFQPDNAQSAKIPAEFKDIDGPVIGYYGHLADWVDLELIAWVAKERPQYKFLLIGRNFTDTRLFSDLKNVILTGARPYAKLPDYVRLFKAAIIPFKQNTLTKFVNPLKLLEYFASEKPVVATYLPEYDRFSGALYLANSREEFLAELDRAVKNPDPEIVRKAAVFAREHTWEQRSGQVAALIFERMKSNEKN